MSGFTFNKIAGAVLGTVLFGFLIVELSHALYPSPRGGEHVEQMGYPVAAADHGDGHGDATEIPEEPVVDLAALMANADAGAGADGFRVCAGCHSIDAGGRASIGPNLYGIVGRPIGSADGFTYSGAMSEFGGNWSFENLFAFLERPAAFMSGTAMRFNGVRNDESRASLIAYLNAQSTSPLPLPTAASAVEALEEVSEEVVEEMEETTEELHEDALDVVEEHTEDGGEGEEGEDGH